MMDSPPPPVRDHIFISYRRDDARGASGRLYDWLRIAFGREHVFRDVHSIGAGKWRDRIDAALAQSAVCVAVIGPRWANADNLPRLHDEADMVRHELVTALASSDCTLLPALVEGARSPRTADLPRALQPLLEWNALSITEEGWDDDTRRLIAAIENAAGLHAKPDLDTLLRDVAEAQQRTAELERTRHLQAGQIDGLRRTVDELTRKLAEASAGERPGLSEAFAALARGDSLAAEDAFEREFEARSRVVDEERRTMAQAARNVANLALLRDLTKAVSFYRKALAIDSEDAETARLLGDALILLGDVGAAEAAFSQSLSAAIAQHDSWGEMAAQGGLGDVFQQRGNLEEAHRAFQAALHIALRILSADPLNTRWQRDLSVCLDKIGDVEVAQGNGQGALAAYRQSLAIRALLAERDPANTEWQRGLSFSHNKIGGVLAAHGNGPGALAAYRQSLALREALAERDPANTEWQRDLSVIHNKIGEVLLVQGDVPGALAAYRQSLALREALAERDPANTRWQRDLSVIYDKVGDVLLAQGDRPGALAIYRRSLAIAETLAGRDPANTEWQRDLSLSHTRIGNVLADQNDAPGALAAHRHSLAIAEALAERDPANTQWQRDLSYSYNKIAEVLMDQGNRPGALAAYRQSLAIREALAGRDPANTDWQRDLSVSHNKIGDVLAAQGNVPGALAAYRQSLAIREALAERDLANADWQRYLSVSHNKIGDMLVAQGDRPGAFAAYRRGLAIIETLARRDPANAERERDLIVSFVNLSQVTGDKAFAGQALDIALRMQQRGALAPRDAWMIEDLKQRSGR